MKYIISCLLLIITLIATPAYAVSIDVLGNKRISDEAVISFLDIKSSQSLNQDDLDEAMSNAYATGFFEDISIDTSGQKLNIYVIENPIVSEIVINGSDEIDEKDILSEIKLSPREVYSKSTLNNDKRRILNIYKRSGRFSTSVTTKTEKLSQNRVKIIFNVKEGKTSSITKIAFIGNDNFSNARLRRIINTKESTWYRFFSSSDNYDPDRVEFDKELLRRHYIRNGYADFKVTDSNAELTPSEESFVISFTINEGKQYKFGKIGTESYIEQVKPSEIQELLETTQEGKIYNAELVDQTINNITSFLGDKGYAFVNIEPRYRKNSQNSQLDINYIIKESPRVYVENINISGNDRTLDKVIRREFRLAEGDPYNASKLKRSKQRINNLGFFKVVDFKNSQGSSHDKVDIDVQVEEQSTGELTFGAGFSSTDGALGDISISERNLLGRGQFLKLNFTMAAIRQEVDLSFTEPYFMGRDIAAGFDLFKIKRDGSSSRTNLTYDNDTTGGTLRASYPVTEHLKHSVRYSYRSDKITDIDPGASVFIKLQEGENDTSLIGHTLTYDKVDNRFDPTEGYLLQLKQDVAGLGGDSKYFKNEVKGVYYRPILRDDIILKLSTKAGHIDGYNDKDVRINDRFFVGSRGVRGFASEGIGPRDSLSKDPLGGKIFATTSVEAMFPIGLPEELGIKGAVFGDAGTLFETDDSNITVNGVTSKVLDESSVRASLGVGLSWKSPLGPIRIDWAKAVVKESFDETEEFKFSFGTRF